MDYQPADGKREKVHTGQEGERKYVKDKYGSYTLTKKERIRRSKERQRIEPQRQAAAREKRKKTWQRKRELQLAQANKDAKIKLRKQIAPTSKGQEFVNSKHSRVRKNQRQITNADIAEALAHPMHEDPVEVDDFGRRAKRFIGERTVVVLNPDTKQVITTYPTSKKFRNRYGKGSEK